MSPTNRFLRAQLFETYNEIVSQIGMKLPETFSRRSHQVETRGCASIPLIYGNQTSAAIAVVQGFEAQAREFWRAVDEIDHSQRMLNSYSWHSAPANDGYCAGFRTPECRAYPRARAAGVRKAPRHEIAVGGALAVPRALWGFDRGVGFGEVGAKRSAHSLWLVWLEAWVRVRA